MSRSRKRSVRIVYYKVTAAYGCVMLTLIAGLLLIRGGVL